MNPQDYRQYFILQHLSIRQFAGYGHQFRSGSFCHRRPAAELHSSIELEAVIDGVCCTSLYDLASHSSGYHSVVTFGRGLCEKRRS